MTERDRATGRYAHVWGVLDEIGLVEQCQHCGRFRAWRGERWVRVTLEEALALIGEQR